MLESSQLIQVLVAAGVYRSTWDIKDVSYTTLDRDWIASVAWPNWVRSLPPELVESIEIGGKSILRPKWIAEVFDCDNHTFSFTEYVIRCCAVDCAKKRVARGGTSLGAMSYIAIPRAGNRRQGGHDINWLVDHNRGFHWFEASEGSFITPEQIEVASVWEGMAR